MATLIPDITLVDFSTLTPNDIKRLKCCEVYDDNGEYLFTFIRPRTDFIRASSESSGQLSNSIGGELLEEILASPVSNDPVTPLSGVSGETITSTEPKEKRKYKRHKHRKVKV